MQGLCTNSFLNALRGSSHRCYKKFHPIQLLDVGSDRKLSTLTFAAFFVDGVSDLLNRKPFPDGVCNAEQVKKALAAKANAFY
jgi:hypothetical protein